MFRTATRVCSGLEEREESLAPDQRVAAMNGYTNQISRSRTHKGVVRQSRDSTHADKIPFCLPFISNEVSTAIRQCLRRAAVDKYGSVVEIPPNIHLTNSCGEEYVGETARPLCARIKEHPDGKEKSRPTTPLGAHRRPRHDGVNFEVTVKILAREPQTSARKTLEALWIHTKSSKMSRKEECLSDQMGTCAISGTALLIR
ncbi:hypothetical protein Y032_0108g17 [Ancylostoma ceylanicum]|uniref:Uncharacterized protein n=1 Tax=Ancylostoma ceylanicum TaxID=53326 RepID=A0A016TE82_9BILA|nr:hypothetical protein Y032_0108g17 [Ancylostoma ceylanicum]